MPESGKCGFCRRGREAVEVCGKLFENDDCVAHKKCMQYSACLVQYKSSFGFGGFKIDKVKKEQYRGRTLKCSICKKQNKTKKYMCNGATAGCANPRCKKTFHYYCAKQNLNVKTKRLVTKQPRSNGTDRRIVKYRVYCSVNCWNKCNNSNSQDYPTSSSEESTSEDDDDDDGGGLQLSSESEDESDSGSGTSSENATKHKQETSGKQRQKILVSVTTKRISPKDNETRRPPKKPRLSTAPEDDTDDGTDSDNHDMPCNEGPHEDSNDSTENPFLNVKRKTLTTQAEVHTHGSEESDDSEASTSLISPQMHIKRHSNQKQSQSPCKENTSSIENPSKKTTHRPKGRLSLHRTLKDDIDQDLAGGGDTCQVIDTSESIAVIFVEDVSNTKDILPNLKHYIEDKYEIPQSCVHVWNDTIYGSPLSGSDDCMLYYIRELGDCLVSKTVEKLKDKMFNLDEKTMIQLQSFSEYHSRLGNKNHLKDITLKSIRKDVCEKIAEANSQLGHRIGGYCQSVKLNHRPYSFLVLILDETLDPRGLMRKKLIDGRTCKVVQIKDMNTKIGCPPGEYDNEISRSKELFIIKHWLKKNLRRSYKVCVLPEDDVLTNDNVSSVTKHLKSIFQQPSHRTKLENMLVLVGPVDIQFMNFQGYFQKALPYFLKKVEGQFDTLYFIVDVSLCGLIPCCELLPEGYPCDGMSLFTANDSDSGVVSTLIIKVNSKPEVETTVTVAEQPAVTSIHPQNLTREIPASAERQSKKSLISKRTPIKTINTLKNAVSSPTEANGSREQPRRSGFQGLWEQLKTQNRTRSPRNEPQSNQQLGDTDGKRKHGSSRYDEGQKNPRLQTEENGSSYIPSSTSKASKPSPIIAERSSTKKKNTARKSFPTPRYSPKKLNYKPPK